MDLAQSFITLLQTSTDAFIWAEETREAVWGEVTLRWLVTKTYQHTAEHTHDVLRMTLFWGGRPAPLRH